MTTTNTETVTPGFGDKLLVLLAVGAVIAGIVGFYFLEGQAAYLRFLAVVGGLVAGGFIASMSEYGKQFWRFVQGAKIEWRKVVWPSRQDAISQAIAVIAFAFIMGFFFWGLDFILSGALEFFRGTS
ncbi:MAG: preprotein translocase subunit SecE [Gammaproteobacteria bacterium]